MKIHRRVEFWRLLRIFFNKFWGLGPWLLIFCIRFLGPVPWLVDLFLRFLGPGPWLFGQVLFMFFILKRVLPSLPVAV